MPERTMTLNRFIQTAYLPYAERQERRSTFIGYRNMWKRYIKPDGDKALHEFRTFECEQMLLSIARTQDLCRSTLAHIKHFLGGAFRYARRQGVLDSPKNSVPSMVAEVPPPNERTVVISMLQSGETNPAVRTCSRALCGQFISTFQMARTSSTQPA
jgi:hypothetical protein